MLHTQQRNMASDYGFIISLLTSAFAFLVAARTNGPGGNPVVYTPQPASSSIIDTMQRLLQLLPKRKKADNKGSGPIMLTCVCLDLLQTRTACLLVTILSTVGRRQCHSVIDPCTAAAAAATRKVG